MLLAADLVGTAFNVSPDAIPGVASVPLGDDPTFSVSLTVKNQNIVPFLDDSGNFRVRVYLSPNASISTSDPPTMKSTCVFATLNPSSGSPSTRNGRAAP